MDYWEKQKKLKEEEQKRQSIISEMNRNTRQKVKEEREDFFLKIYNGLLFIIGIFLAISIDSIISFSIKFIPSIFEIIENILYKNTISFLWLPLIFLWVLSYIIIAAFVMLYGLQFWIDKYIFKEQHPYGELRIKSLNIFFALFIIVIITSSILIEFCLYLT